MHPALIAILSIIGGLLFLWFVVLFIVGKLRPFPKPWRLSEQGFKIAAVVDTGNHG
jgi:hypothetical protein